LNGRPCTALLAGGNEEAVAFLLSKGMQAMSRDSNGTTPPYGSLSGGRHVGCSAVASTAPGGQGLDETNGSGKAALHLAGSMAMRKW
jgi:hypothetical protein